MSMMDSQPTTQASDSLFRKLVLLSLLTSAAVLWIVVWFRQGSNFPLLLSTFFADASLGLIAGFGARIFLRNRDGFVRYFVAILMVVLGMYLVGALTRWVLGVGPIRFEEKFAEELSEVKLDRDFFNRIGSLRIGSRVLFDFSRLNWADAAHLAVSLVMTVLSLQAWRRPALTPTLEPVEVSPVPATTPRATRSRRGRRVSTSRGGRVQRSARSSAHLRSSPQPRAHSNNGSRPAIRTGAQAVKEPARPKKKRLFQRKPKIQFALVEEHRCPYCLDPVSRNDPRGVKECEVCHTLHHADCWAITGVCQVPHLNT